MNILQNIGTNLQTIDRDTRTRRAMLGVSLIFLVIAAAEYLLNAAPILYILALTFSAIILSGSVAIKLGAGRDIVISFVLVFTYIEAAVAFFALGGLNSHYIMLIILLPIVSILSFSPRVIISTGVMTVVLIAILFSVNDVFFAHMTSPERPAGLQAVIAGLTVIAVTWIFAAFARGAHDASEHAVTATRKELEAAKYSSLAKMAGCVAHEIANPLTILKGHVEVLMASIQAGRADNIEARLASVERTSGRLERLIKILAAMGDPDRGYGPEPIAFSGIISDALTLLGGATESTGVRIEQHVPESPEKAWMHGNRALITTILFELIHSSIQVAKDGKDKKVTLNAERANSHISVSITANHRLTGEEIDRLTRTLNISLMQLLASSMGGSLSVTRGLGSYEQRLDLQLAQPQRS